MRDIARQRKGERARDRKGERARERKSESAGEVGGDSYSIAWECHLRCTSSYVILCASRMLICHVNKSCHSICTAYCMWSVILCARRVMSFYVHVKLCYFMCTSSYVILCASRILICHVHKSCHSICTAYCMWSVIQSNPPISI